MSYKVPFSTKGLQFERQQRNCGLLAKPLLLSDNQTCRRLASRKNLTLRPIVASRKNWLFRISRAHVMAVTPEPRRAGGVA